MSSSDAEIDNLIDSISPTPSSADSVCTGNTVPAQDFGTNTVTSAGNNTNTVTTANSVTYEEISFAATTAVGTAAVVAAAISPPRVRRKLQRIDEPASRHIYRVANARIKKRAKRIFHCKPCGCAFNTVHARALHEAGKPHKRTIQRQKDRSNIIECITCDRRFASTHDLQSHRRGKAHRRKVHFLNNKH